MNTWHNQKVKGSYVKQNTEESRQRGLSSGAASILLHASPKGGMWEIGRLFSLATELLLRETSSGIRAKGSPSVQRTESTNH